MCYINVRDFACTHWLVAVCEVILSYKGRDSENHDTITTLITYYFFLVTLPKILHTDKVIVKK